MKCETLFSVSRICVALLLTCAAHGQEQAAAPCLQKPTAERAYNKERLLAMVRDQTPTRAEFLVKACGVALVWSDSLAPELKAANASDKVIQMVRDMTKPKAPPAPPGPKPGEIRTNTKESVTYAFVPAGTFQMGCDTCDADEKPAHKVRITKAFWMAQREVNVGSFKNYVKAAGIKMPPEPELSPKAFNPKWADSGLPMTMVTWHEAQSYCQWAGMRLPTEAEWEYAARGPAGLAPQELADMAWYADNSGEKPMDSAAVQKSAPRDWIRTWMDNGNAPHKGGTRASNAWNLFDMLGNVWEWTSDWYRDNAYSASGPDDPQGPDAGFHHVLRGGSFVNPPGYVRLTKRLKGIPEFRAFTNGFRCAGATVK